MTQQQAGSTEPFLGRIGRCGRCIRQSFQAAVVALCLAALSIPAGLSLHLMWLAPATAVVAIALTLLWLLHAMVFALRASSVTAGPELPEDWERRAFFSKFGTAAGAITLFSVSKAAYGEGKGPITVCGTHLCCQHFKRGCCKTDAHCAPKKEGDPDYGKCNVPC